jgi:hypothetical protein
VVAADKVAEAKAAVAVDVHRAADKVAEAKAAVAADVHRAAAAPEVVAGWEEAVVVAVLPEAVGAAEAVNSYHSSGASRLCGAPFFY